METAADVEASRICRDYGLESPETIEIEAICWGERLIATEGTIDGADAWLVTSGDYALARVRSDIPYIGQKRFALAHELGHWLLHRSGTGVWYDDEHTLSDYRRDPREVEANAFASSLLVPMKLVQALYLTVAPTFALALEISEKFQVGPILASRRMLALDRATSILLASDGDKVLYYCRSKACNLKALLPGTAVPAGPTSEAACSSGLNRSDIVPASRWFPAAAESDRLREEAFRPSEDSPTLTLLSRA